MGMPLLQLLLLTASDIQNSSAEQLHRTKKQIFSAYQSIRIPCNVITLLSGAIILFSISPFAPELIGEAAHTNITPIVSFLAFLAINFFFLVKFRLNQNYRKVNQAIKQKSESHYQKNKQQSAWHTA